MFSLVLVLGESNIKAEMISLASALALSIPDLKKQNKERLSLGRFRGLCCVEDRPEMMREWAPPKQARA
ncbi:hypothetical protein HRE53_32770 (plasmid) [Acaryochloris sp. 'Moss Beach']|uniref:hypothetical protein n=1 Tax=Acaryochloris sp. 'Moss Beach' TaxID=2740837 RepID=UPI001F34B399|nr:hypothetical protein [Acaryochloris sp. 'Moss Beach']UJB73408.1 hypothetical protein HRE53_32770 [Acaryochloris sp. 'Moss Beach']